MRASASKTRSVDSSKITWKEYDKRPALMLAVESPAEATLAAKKVDSGALASHQHEVK